jgi:hypothetical protein
MQLPSVGTPGGFHKSLFQIPFQKPTDSDYNDRGSRTASTKTSCWTVIFPDKEISINKMKKTLQVLRGNEQQYF